MPLSKAKVEESLSTMLQLKERTEYMANWIGGPISLDDEIEITSASLVLDPNDHFDATSGLTLELSGKCITLADVRTRYEHLLVADVPRGRSLEELTTHTAVGSWGRLSFAFKEARPACVFAISFNALDRQ
jgi:hypothetical protein